ncbi:ANKRD28 [Branchiostoma lanceolatum]|uniref:ANKRD28 protein n=1 Tax=Branchiostoma lanceolatum TaxID=7740 RepID=A0A8K0ENP6_BRALA|nr:ANKRD28 [Branchiostoma lanceolatum]
MALQPNPVYQPELVSSDTLEAASDGRKGKPSESREDEAKELAQLNESLTRAAHTAHGRHPYRYGIASVNFKGDTRGTGNANLRKLLLGQLQEETRMSIIFVQECPWADPVKQLELEETFRYTGLLNEAGIIWNSDLFELKRLDSYKLIGDKHPNLIQHRGRVCISEMSIKVQPTGHTASSNIAVEKKPNVSDFIAISWHGPHKSTDAEKRLIFRDLLAFFKTLTVKENKDGQKACVVGGDFNFRLDKACDNIDDGYPGLTIPASYGSDTIDYFIFTSDLINILHAQQLSLDYDVGSVYTTQDRDRARAEMCQTASNQVIDHSPVFAVLDLGSPNPFSSPSKIRARKIAEPSRVDVTPDRSSYRRTQATPGSSLKENKERPAGQSVVGDNMSQADGERKGESPLHWASRDGHLGIVSTLLRGGVDVNTRDSMQRTPLHEAAVNNHIETVKALLVAGADVNARDMVQSTPLHDASTKGHHETVQALLVALADVHAQDIEKSTPLHMAAANGGTETVKTLLKAGADVNARDKEQRTPLHLTARNGYHETVSALLMMAQGQVDVNAFSNQKWTPLHMAAMNGQHKAASVLLTAKADVNARDNELNTPIREAEQRGHQTCVEAMQKHEADNGSKDKNFISNYRRSKGETKQRQRPPAGASGDDPATMSSAAGAASAAEQVPKRGSAMDEKEQEMKEKDLCEAAKNGETAKVKQLLDEGVSFHATRGSLKRTPLHLSAENGHHKTVIALLMARAAVDTQDVAGRTALHMAAVNGHHNSVLSLVGAGATVNARGDQQLTPVHLAAMNGHHETVTALHTAGADVKARDDEGRIPLHLAANNGYHETVSALLTAGSNVNAKNNEQRTSMHLAAMNGHHETVTLLAAAPGADVNAKDNEKSVPLHEATVHGHPKCVEVLLQHGADVAAKNEKGLSAKDIAKDGDTSSIEAGRNKEEIIRGRKEIMKLLQEENARISRERRKSQAVLIRFYEDRGMTKVKKNCPLIKEAAEESGKSVEQVKSFINRRKRKGDTDSAKTRLGPSGSSGDTVATETKDGVKKRRTEGAGVEDADDQGKPLQSKQADISVLLVNDEYGGHSTMNRRVAQLLLKHGAKVYSTALKATEEDKRCAANDGVNLILPKRKGDMRPSLDWLTYYNSVHYPNIPRNLQYIVGYADVTSKAAKNIKEERCQEAKLVLFNHEMPDDNTTKKAADKVTTIIKDAKSADAVFSVGNRIYTHFETKYRSLEEIEPRHHYLFLPRASPVFEATGSQPGGGERLVLIFARMSEVMAQKGLDLAARAMGYAAQKIGNMSWVVRWIQEDEDDWEKNKKTLEKKIQSPTIKPTIRPYGTQEEIARDIQHAHLVMVTSRSEPFGLVGLEAIAAGIPVLIPDQSGLADMIKDLIRNNKCHADMRHRILVTSAGPKESDMDATARRWADKISDSLEFSSHEFEKAAEFKKKLLESKYWEESHNNLLRVFGLNE